MKFALELVQCAVVVPAIVAAIVPLTVLVIAAGALPAPTWEEE